MTKRQPIKVKICGITDPASAHAAVEFGAAYLGFISFPASPRHLTLDAAKVLAAGLPPLSKAHRVGVFVDASAGHIARFAGALELTHIQCHGKEDADQIQRIKALTGLKVIKSVTVKSAADLDKLTALADVADMLLLDAPPPKGSDLPGGNGVTVNWDLLNGLNLPCPWFLAGGLRADTVQTAVEKSGASLLDLSSGVESAPGVKDVALIRSLLSQIHSL